MATPKALVQYSGKLSQVVTTDSLAVGAGIISSQEDLVLSVSSGAVKVQSDKNFAVQGTGAITVASGGIGSTSASSNLQIGTDANTTSITLGDDGTTSGITIGGAGVTTQINGTLKVGVIEAIETSTTFNDDITFGDDAATDTVTFVARVVPDIVFDGSAAAKIMQMDDAATSSAISLVGGKKTSGTAGAASLVGGESLSGTGGAVNLNGGAGTTANGSVNIGAANTLQVNVTPAMYVAGALYANGGVDNSTPAALALGASSATSVELAQSTVLTKVKGGFQVDEASNLNGDVTLGNAAADSITFSGSVAGDINFVKEATHTIQVTTSSSSDTAGGALYLKSGVGFQNANGGVLALNAGNAGATGGIGGAIQISAGASSTGTGGDVTIYSGGGMSRGAVKIDAGGMGTGGALEFGKFNAASLALGHMGITTTVTGGLTQLTGAVSLSGNAASSFTTSSGALTLTSAEAATWSTGAGALTLTSAAAATWSTAAGELSLSGFAGLNLEVNGSDYAKLASSAMTMQSGITLDISSAIVNLPAGAGSSSPFKIGGTSVNSANLTAANMQKLFDGSNADALHTHAGVAAADIVIPSLDTSACSAGDLAYVSGANALSPALADDIATAVAFGVVKVVHASTGEAYAAGVQTVSYVGSAPDAGDVLFLSAATAGKVTNAAPSSAGDVVVELGIALTAGSGGSVDMLWQPKSAVQL